MYGRGLLPREQWAWLCAMGAWLCRSGRGLSARGPQPGPEAAFWGQSRRFWGWFPPVLGPLPGPVQLPGNGGHVALRLPPPFQYFSCSLRPPSRHSSFPRILPQIRDGSVAKPLGAVSPQCHGPAAIAHHLPALCCLGHPGALRGCLLLCADILGLFGGIWVK